MLLFTWRIRLKGVAVDGCRRLLATQAKQSWKAMSDTERSVWTQLAWTEDKWNGADKSPAVNKWDSLDAAQKSAVMYGLKLDESEWNALVDDEKFWATEITSKRSAIAASPPVTTVKSVASSIAWTALKIVGPAARAMSGPRSHPALNLAGQLLGHSTTLLDEFADPVIIPSDGIETVLYLDDSGSMDAHLYEGKAALDTISPLLQGTSVRILKFGTGKTVLSPRDNSFSTALTCLNWDAKSGSTYMWKMIQDDVMQRYRPSPSPGGAQQGKLRLIVITDGFDTQSPGEYRGIRGMDPMMRTLLAKNYNVEFHIIVLGKHSGAGNIQALKRYQSLAEATGGGYLALNGNDLFFNEKSPAVKNFVSSLEASNDSRGSASLRRKQRQEYLKAAAEGRREKFDWLKSLPP